MADEKTSQFDTQEVQIGAYPSPSVEQWSEPVPSINIALIVSIALVCITAIIVTGWVIVEMDRNYTNATTVKTLK